MINIVWILFAFALVLLNAFFVAAEFAMVKLRNTRVQAIKNIYGWRGRILAEVHQRLDAYLSACQLGITLASLGLGWIGEPAFTVLFEPILPLIGIASPEIITGFSIFCAFFIISFLHIVAGELMPKSLAIRQSEQVSLWTAIPLYGFYWVMYPAIWLLNSCSLYLLKLFQLGKTDSSDHFYSTEEIKILLNSSHLHGELSKEKAEMLEHTLDFAELKVTEVMRPREEMIIINITDPIENIIALVMTKRYSRYPVFDPEKQEVIGIIHVKDLFSTLYKQGQIKDLAELIRPVLMVSRHLPAIELLRKFREGMPHFALVYTGQKILIGFITLDNLLQILIGRIKDEFHRTTVDWHKNEDGTFSVKGDCTIYSLEQALDHEITIDSEEDDIDTITGLIFHRLRSLPTEGQQISFTEFDAVIEKMQGSRILLVRVIPKSN